MHTFCAYEISQNTKFNAFVALASNGQRHHVNCNNPIWKPMQLIKCGFACVIFFKSSTSFRLDFILIMFNENENAFYHYFFGLIFIIPMFEKYFQFI